MLILYAMYNFIQFGYIIVYMYITTVQITIDATHRIGGTSGSEQWRYTYHFLHRASSLSA